MWDKRLFEINEDILDSPYYIDKLKRVAGFFKNRKGKFLDIGFGAGNLERLYLVKYEKIDLYGIDFSPKAVKSARKNIKGRYTLAKSQKLPYKNNFFENAAMLDVLEHIPKIESSRVLNEINRVLRTNAFLVISVPLNEDLEKMNRDGTNFNEHLRQYTSSILEKELVRAGFKVVKREFIYAFRTNYYIKNVFIKLFPYLKKPNVLIIFAQKR